MRIGLIARADQTGLAVLTWNFWNNLSPDATLVVDLSMYGHPAPDMTLYPDGELWRPLVGPGPDPDVFAPGWPDPVIDRFLDRVDVVFTCETPYNYYLYEEARRRGIKTVLQPMFEFMEYVEPGFPEPDVFALASPWHVDDITAALPGREIVHLPVPVDRQVLPYHHRTELSTILHTAGTVAQPNRNGTVVLYRAMELLTDLPVRAVVYAQRDTFGQGPPDNVELRLTTIKYYWDFYRHEFDVMVLPRRWGGLCLPMQEALAVGMPVLMPDCDPNNAVLPDPMLLPCHVGGQLMTRSTLDLYDVEPEDLAAHIRWYYENPAVVDMGSKAAGAWGDEHSWDALRDDYLRVLTP